MCNCQSATCHLELEWNCYFKSLMWTSWELIVTYKLCVCCDWLHARVHARELKNTISIDIGGATFISSLQIVLQRKLPIVCDEVIGYHRFNSIKIWHLLLVVMPFNFCSDQAEEKLRRASALERERPVYCRVAGRRHLGLFILVVGSLSFCLTTGTCSRGISCKEQCFANKGCFKLFLKSWLL